MPAGLDAYRHWERWPYLRFGVRAYLRSTYDRTGHNRTADASHYLYQEAETFNVTLDVEGQGVLYFARANRWHGSPWHYEVDGRDHLVEETTTADPLLPLPDSTFMPEAAFPKPLAYTYATTKGADLSWVPIAFEQRLRIGHSRTYYGSGYYIYHLHAGAHGLAPWSIETAPGDDVLALLGRAGTDIVDGIALRRYAGVVQVPDTGRVPVARLDDGPAMLRRLDFSAPEARARDLGRARLIVTWDDRVAASIDAPLDLFHGAGTLHNPDGREWLVRSLPVSVRFHAGRVHLGCYLPMPYFDGATIELAGGHDGGPIEDLRWEAATEPYTGPWNHVGYCHATFRDHAVPCVGHDLEFLDTAGIEGADHWSGSIIGTSFVFTRRSILTTLEGDPRFYFDDSLTPQVQGTGTEEWGGGGDYWGGRTMTLPLAGHPTGTPAGTPVTHPDQRIHSAYRFLLADLMPFGRRARVCFEHGGENESLEHYTSVTYWYGLPDASLVLTDSLEVGDSSSEAAHDYVSPDATAPYAVQSRYEWGPDHLPESIAGPLATPGDYVEFTFAARAGRYHLWLETRAGDEPFEAALWAQVDSDIGTTRYAPENIGALGIQNIGRPPGRYRFVTGAAPASTIELGADGPHRLRLQPRHGIMRLARVVLSRGLQRPGTTIEATPDTLVLSPQSGARTGAFDLVADPAAPGGEALALLRPPGEFEVYPAHTLIGRRTQTASEFTLKVDPDNHGVLLRRTLDYACAHQRARVHIAAADGAWMAAGIWYLAGSSTVYHSFPWAEGELAPSRPRVITSNRRFRDDEFLLAAELTRGKQHVRVRVEFAPRNPPLLPGRPPADTGWTEFAYHAYCYVMPRVPERTARRASP